ncbi:MAG: PIG-L deacetylase family protein [Salipiger thiooxidans]|uniref:PIG-L deacetylase family protein n=1 Tax=Salipiger thiooxidans TaxID=282683 RepID=UPI00299D8F71|nr:PIG-L family deacetylase [Salipiger thiooxidans]
MTATPTALVISTRAADFVWRCGGAIALHAAKGYDVTVLSLSFGERGESARLWREGKTQQQVKDIRRAEAEKAAGALGVHEHVCLDMGDYPLEFTAENKARIVEVIRKVQPDVMLSHSRCDPYNTEHMNTTQAVLECRMIAQTWGHDPGEKVLGGAAALSLRAAPDRADGLDAGHLPRHHTSLGPQAGRHRMHGRAAAPLGLLHPRRAATGRPLQAQLWRPVGRARLPIR